MKSHALVFTVRLHEPRYHGEGDWPPAPARVFQALVAAASLRLDDPGTVAALEWLEAQPAPTIAAPRSAPGQAIETWVPNNDLDTKGGDPAKLPELRVAKRIAPLHLAHCTLLYVWELDPGAAADAHAARVCALADGLYQLGRGVDMAYAEASIQPGEAVADLLAAFDGQVHRPSIGEGGTKLLAPRSGSLNSLRVRHVAAGQRFRQVGAGRQAAEVFVQPPKALFHEVTYDAGVRRMLFELREELDLARFASVSLSDAHAVVVAWRDAAAARLVAAGLDAAIVNAVLVGRRPGEAERVPTAFRAHLMPVPSIGHQHADHRIRRLIFSVPDGGPLSVDDLRWALSGLVREGSVLVEAEDPKMGDEYAGRSTCWASVTPLALPAARRRIDPAHVAEEAKGAPEREAEERDAVQAVRQALRHAGVAARPTRIDVQREPLQTHGERAECFAAQPRFPKERLWHVRVRFAEPVVGPLALGDGRFVGLGVMAPDSAPRGAGKVYAWSITEGLDGPIDAVALAGHLRRAVIARAQAAWGRAKLPEHVTGHRLNGEAATGHGHLHHQVDPARGLLIVVASESDARLERALAGFDSLRAGEMGVLRLAPGSIDAEDPLLRPSQTWTSRTPYRVNRHQKAADALEAVALDVREACREAKLPEPLEVAVSEVRSRSGVGVEATVALRFAHAVIGPVMLGKTRHRGGGLFGGSE